MDNVSGSTQQNVPSVQEHLPQQQLINQVVPTAQASPTPPLTSNPVKKSHHLVIFIIFGLVVVIILLSTIIFFLLSQKNTAETSNSVSDKTIMAVPTRATMVNETNTWKDYQDSTNLYQISYPSTWILEDCGVGYGVLLNPTQRPTCATEPTEPIQFYVDKKLKTVSAYEKKWSGTGFKASLVNTLPSGAKEYSIVKVDPAPGPDVSVQYVIPMSESLFIMTLNDPMQKEIAEKMISTFTTEITNKSNTTNLNSYTNTAYKFSIQYPKNWKAYSIDPGPGELPLYAESHGMVLFPQKYSSTIDAKTYIQIETDGTWNLAAPSYEDWISKGRDVYYKVTNRTTTTFNGQPAAVVTGTFENNNVPVSISTTFFTSPDKKTYYSIQTISANNDEDAQMIDGIIETFQFTK